jgi:outer membrane protein assembly factor BamB
MGNGDYVHPAEELNQPRGGAVWCLDISDLSIPPPVVWRYATDDTVLGAIAIHEGMACFASREGRLHSVRTADGQRWDVWDARASTVTAPAVTKQAIYLLTGSGAVQAIAPVTFQPIWQCQAASKSLLISSPVVAHGHIYLGTEHDGLICAGELGQPEPPVWASALGGPGSGGNPGDEPLPPLGAFAWQFPVDQMGESQETVVAAPVAVAGDLIYVPLAGDKLKGLAALDVAQASEEAPTPQWVYPTANPVWQSPAVAGRVVVVDGRRGDANRHLHVVNEWTSPVSPEASGVFALGREHIVVQDRQGELSCFTDVFVWRRTVGEIAHSPAIADQLLVVAAVEPPALRVFDLPTGEPLWQVELNAIPTVSPVIDKDKVLLATDQGLQSRRLLDGQPQPDWPTNLPAVSSELVVRREWIAYVSDASELIIADRKTGSIQRRVPGATPGVTPTTSSDQLIYAGAEALWSVSPTDAAPPRQWAETGWLGPPTTSPVVDRGQLYMGRRGWGLVRFGAAP